MAELTRERRSKNSSKKKEKRKEKPSITVLDVKEESKGEKSNENSIRQALPKEEDKQNTDVTNEIETSESCDQQNAESSVDPPKSDIIDTGQVVATNSPVLDSKHEKEELSPSQNQTESVDRNSENLTEVSENLKEDDIQVEEKETNVPESVSTSNTSQQNSQSDQCIADDRQSTEDVTQPSESDQTVPQGEVTLIESDTPQNTLTEHGNKKDQIQTIECEVGGRLYPDLAEEKNPMKKDKKAKQFAPPVESMAAPSQGHVGLKVKQEEPKVQQYQPLTLEQLQSLYYNPQLAENENFLDRFVQAEMKKENHEFYEILLSYLRAQKNLQQTEGEVIALQQSYSEFREQVWITCKQSVNAKGPCGDGATCRTTHMYEVAEFKDEPFKIMNKSLSSIRSSLQNNLSLHSYSSQLARLQVESYIHNLFMSSPLLRDIPKNAPVQVCHQHKREHQHQITRLRDCISVLFTFHRKPVQDAEFVKNIRTWTQRLVSALVRVASYEDHLFVLNHILRCPAGVGQWAVNLIQIPTTSLTNERRNIGDPVLDHIMTCLATTLMPIRAREEFMCLMKEAVTPDPNSQNANWILVDSDGEEDDDPKNAWLYLHENDFVAILSQFPLSDLFKHILLVTRTSDDKDRYEIERTTDIIFLKIIAFCTCLLNIFRYGLSTYNMARYKQLNKRIGRMIRMAIQYVSDHWQNFQDVQRSVLPPDVIQRLQMEFNRFFLRGINCILSAERLGSWQFMTDIPYGAVSKETMWQLLWLLHQGKGQTVALEELPTEIQCKKFLADPDSRMQLADVISTLPTSEVIYLLTALANMAESRKLEETEFIQAVALNLFEISFVCSDTREMCSKVGRELLHSVATSHPFVLSLLLQRTKENMEHIGMMALYLFKELPFHLWLPCEPDVAVLKQWLLNSELTDPQNQLARKVLSKINWDIAPQTDRLFVPHQVHKQIAILLTQCYGKFISSKHFGYFFTEGIKQVASILKQQQTNEQVFNNWAWELAMRLHLHHSNLPTADLAGVTGKVPNLVSDNSLLPVVKELKEKNPMACYVALAVSEFGHSDAIFMSEGLNQLLVLAESHHYKPVLQILSYVVPLFSSKPESLFENEKFIKTIQLLLAADDSLMKVAKSIWSHDFPGPMVKQFGCMIQHQINQSRGLNESLPVQILLLWIQVLTNQNKWYIDKNTCYILDVLVKTAFTSKGGFQAVQNVFQKVHKQHLTEGHQQGAVSSFVNWVSSGAACVSVPSLMEKMSSSESFGWLGFLILDLEYRMEEETKLWSTIREEINKDGKQSPEQALKKATIQLKLELAPGLNSLNIYQWAKLALNMPVDHPLLALVWQRFFCLFLGRYVSQVSMQQRASAGEKFYESSKYSSNLKKMKKRLGETANFHMNYPKNTQESQSEAGQDADSEDVTNRKEIEDLAYIPQQEFHLNLSRMFQTYQLWVQEPMLHDAKLYLPALPQQYQSDRLLTLFQNKVDPWMEFLDMDRVIYELAQMSSEWQNSFKMEEETVSRLNELKQNNQTATERILSRFTRHNMPVDLPTLQPLKAIVPEITTMMLDEKPTIMHLLQLDLSVLKEYAKSFHAHIAKHVAIDDDFSKLMPKLYYNQPKQVKVTIECKSVINPLHKCSNPAVVNVMIREKSIDSIVQRQIDENRAEFKQLIIEGLAPPPQNVCVAAVHVENAITALVKISRSCTDTVREANYTDVACSLFYSLAEMYNDDIEFYPPTKQFFTACIDLLGKEFIEKTPSQTETVMQLSLDSRVMAELMSPHFIPINSPHTYVTMYERLVQVFQQQTPDVIFMLLTKFEISNWLKEKMPAQIEIKRFLDILGTALYNCGMEPDKNHSMVIEIFLRHVKAILKHQFPFHVNSVMNVILRGTAEQKLSTRCWEILHSCCFTKSTEVYITTLSENGPPIHRVSTEMSIHQAKEILTWMGSFFLQLRTSSVEFATFGLYPKLAEYVPYIREFIRDLMLCFIDKAMPSLSEMSPAELLEMLWQTSVHVFIPWIQQLPTNDSPLLPWIQADTESGRDMVATFTFILEYINNCFKDIIPPYQPDLLMRLWLYFCDMLSIKNLPPHVATVYNVNFTQLPWKQLKPDFNVLNSMMKFKDNNSSEGFDLLAHIVCEIDWTEILKYYYQFYPGEGLGRVHFCLLLLLIQCYGDQKHIELPALEQKTITAERYDWQFLASDGFRHASNWFLQHCDPKCILAERSSSASLGLRLLKAASEFSVQSSTHWSSDLSAKRQCYVHSVIQLMCQCTFQSGINLDLISTFLINLLTEIETVTGSVTDLHMQQNETLDLVKEVIGLLNNCNPDNESLSEVMTTIIQWLQSSPSSLLLMPCVRAASRCLASHKLMVQIIEECIQVYFKGGLDQVSGGGWDHVLAAIQIPDLNIEEFLDTALENGSYLLMYGYVVQRLPLSQDLAQERILIGQILDWISKAKPNQENESKMLLLWFKCMEMILKQLNFGCKHDVIAKMLANLITSLRTLGEDRASGGLLGAIGLGKKSSLSPLFRISSRSLSAMISVQIHGESSIRLQPGQPLANNSLAKQEVGALQSMKTNKQYQLYKTEIMKSIDFVQNTAYTFKETLDLIRNLSVVFYSDKEFLSVIHLH